MTTQHIHPEHNDWQEPVGEQSSASENSAPSLSLDASLSDEQPSAVDLHAGETLAEIAATDNSMPVPSTQETAQVDSFDSSPTSVEQLTELTFPVASEAETPLVDAFSLAQEEQIPFSTTPASPAFMENQSSSPLLFPVESDTPVPAGDDVVRPFTDFFEEFRQREVHLTLVNEEQPPFTGFPVEVEALTTEDLVEVPAPFAEVFPEEQLAAPPAEEILYAPEEVTSEIAPVVENVRPVLTQPSLSAERPVSPLLRPATRIRLPRHSRHRIEELIQPAELQAVASQSTVEEKVPAEPPAVEEQSTRPARRYRFDRPATKTPAASVTPARTVVPREKPENGQSAEPVRAASVANTPPAPEPLVTKPPVQPQEPAPVISEAEITPPPAVHERRRRSSHDRQREKDTVTPVQAAPVPEVVIPEPEPIPAPAVVEEIAVEDLPPLEYAELQAANSRRRRRRRAGSASTVAVSNNGKVALPEIQPQPLTPPPVVPLAPTPRTPPVAPVSPPSAAAQNYNIVSGYTVSQMNQGNDLSGPFMGPEPSPARGSSFSTPTPTLRHVRTEALRTAPTPKHTEASIMSPASVNYLANTLAQAVQLQTDRMVAELRHVSQVPTNVSVSLPPFPSTERVGVFVDVANLLYSARTLRLTVDFGKLLDFLRGNRRLVRAQAYCPTSPQAGDDQMFLQAVKGLGYRITTKNYKTFSSGAKKADLDLDLCMDVVRLVDGKAVDCIVLVSGDSDFMPMLDYCSDHGVRVEVAAFDESMSATLRQSCDLFVNLSMLEEIRS